MSQGEKKVLIPAGAEGFPVRAAGDFIFVRAAAFPVRVIVDGQPITMEAGEKRVLKRKNPLEPAFDSFQVDNLSTVAQQVIFITGEGDYEKIIVSGELNVSAFVTTAQNGQAASLPFRTQKEIKAVSYGQVQETAGDLVWDFGDPVGYASVSGIVEVDGLLVGVAKDGYSILNRENGTAVEYSFLSTPVEYTGGTLAGAVAYRGKIYYVYSKTTGVSIYELNIGGGILTLKALNVGPYSTNSTGAFVMGDELIFIGRDYNENVFAEISGQPAQYILRVNLTDFSSSVELLKNSDGGSINTVFNGTRTIDVRPLNLEFPFIRYNSALDTGSPRPQWIDENLIARGDVPSGLGFSNIASAYSGFHSISEDGRYFLSSYNGSQNYAMTIAMTRVLYAHLTVEDVGAPETLRDIYIYEPFDFVPRATDIVIHGGTIELILKAINGSADNWADYVTGYKFSDGKVTREVNSGTQTFALRGIADNFPVLVDSVVELEILPEFFK